MKEKFVWTTFKATKNRDSAPCTDTNSSPKRLTLKSAAFLNLSINFRIKIQHFVNPSLYSRFE